MGHHIHLAAGLCSLVLLSGFADAAQIKLRKSGERISEVLLELTFTLKPVK